MLVTHRHMLQDFCPGGFPKEKQITKHCTGEVLRPGKQFMKDRNGK